MTTNHPLSLFVSSKMEELAPERKAVQAALSDYNMYGWLWENDAGARPFALRSTYLKEVGTCDIYIGLFWLGYGPYTIEEYEYARAHDKYCLLYEKHSNIENRDPQLMQFLKRIEKVDSADSLTVRRFTDAEELADFVQQDVIRLLTGIFRESRDQPAMQLPVIEQQGESLLQYPETERSNEESPVQPPTLLGTTHSTSAAPTRSSGNTLGRTLTIMEQVELTDKLLNCGAISDQSQRESVLAMLPADLKQRIIRGNTDITDVLQIVKKSTEYDSGIEMLVRATRYIDGDTRSVRAVVAYLRKLGFPIL